MSNYSRDNVAVLLQMFMRTQLSYVSPADTNTLIMSKYHVLFCQLERTMAKLLSNYRIRTHKNKTTVCALLSESVSVIRVKTRAPAGAAPGG